MIPSSGSMRSPLPESRYVDLRVHHHQHRFETPQDAVGAPVLDQLDHRPLEVAAVLFELASKRENSANESAAEPAKPARTLSL